jgi:hypothetical protein
MAKKKQVRLAINLLATGRHNASWKTLPNPQELSTDIDTFVEIAKAAERGRLDGIFLADGHAGVGEESFRRPFRSLAPSVLLATLAAHTKHIGLVSTIPALYGNPATVAREIASLDHVSKGRAAWNIITSQGFRKEYESTTFRGNLGPRSERTVRIAEARSCRARPRSATPDQATAVSRRTCASARTASITGSASVRAIQFGVTSTKRTL